MRICNFNFNNEVDTFEIHVEDDGRVSVPGENGQVLAQYDNVQQLAETYALARDVKPDNLKNWTLLENGNVYSFVLRAGTAGITVSEAEEQLDGVFASLAGNYHPLNIARAKDQVMADGSADLVEALVHCTETDIARDVYDAMGALIDGNEEAVAPVEEAVDTRSELEVYVDSLEAVPGALNFLAVVAGIPVGSEKAALVTALEGNIAFRNVETLRTVVANAVNAAINEGIGVNNADDAYTVLTQTAAGTKADDDRKNRLVVGTRMAGRSRVNISVDIVGETHIKHTAEMVTLEELAAADLLVRGNVPYIVRFSNTIDTELEAERDAAAIRDEVEYDDEYDEDPEEEYDEDEYDEEEEE